MIAAIIQARMASTRFPGKILKDLSGKPMLWHVVERARQAKILDQVIVATTTNAEDNQTAVFCEAEGIPHYRSSAEDVLERYFHTAKHFGVDTIVRVTADCPLIDPEVIDECVRQFKEGAYDYQSNTNPGPRTFPRGLDVEVLSFSALEDAHRNAKEQYEREHVTPFIWENKSGQFRLGTTVTAQKELAGAYRLTVDYPEDFEAVEKLYQKFYTPGQLVDMRRVIPYLDQNPEIPAINVHCEQKPLQSK